ncbi:MAG: SRPBCC family protein [Allobranchiibius sp.]
MSVRDSVVIVGVTPQAVFDAVSDPSQMGRWSPENTGADIATAGRPAPVGTTFVGANRRYGLGWRTACVVTESDPGRRFAFDVVAIGRKKPFLRAPVARWEYVMDETRSGNSAKTGTLVTEIWTDGRRRWPYLAVRVFDAVATKGSTFAIHQRANIASTLAALKKDLEKDLESSAS